MRRTALVLLTALMTLQARAAIYLATYKGELLTIDDSTYNVVRKTKFKTGLARMMLLMPDKKRMLIMTSRYSGFEIIDLEKGEVVDAWDLGTNTARLRPTSMALDPTGRYVYTIMALYTKKIDRWEIGDDKLAVIDLVEHKVVRQELFPKDKKQGRFGTGVRISPDGKSLYLFGNSVLIFDTATLKLAKEINLAKPMFPGMARVNFIPEIDPHDSPETVTALFQTEDPYVHRAIFGVGKFDLNTRNFDFTPIGTSVPWKGDGGGMSNVRLSEDRKTGYAVASFGENGDKTCQFWSFDIPSKTLKAREEFACNSRFSFSSSYDGKDLLLFGAGFEISVYDAATLKLKKVVNLGNDVTMSGMVVTAPESSQIAATH